MRAELSAALCFLVLLGFAPPVEASETYKIDKGHTSVIFKVRHMNLANFYGRFNETEGQIIYDAENPSGSSIEFQIKSETIDTNSEKRNKSLKGPDYLNVKQFPFIVFRSKSVKAKGADLEVSGEMTLLGVTRPLTVLIKKIGEGDDPWGGYRIGFETRFSFLRSDFGMKYNLKGLGDEIDTIVSIEGIKK